jgi:hypothetical protein
MGRRLESLRYHLGDFCYFGGGTSG